MVRERVPGSDTTPAKRPGPHISLGAGVAYLKSVTSGTRQKSKREQIVNVDGTYVMKHFPVLNQVSAKKSTLD